MTVTMIQLGLQAKSSTRACPALRPLVTDLPVSQLGAQNTAISTSPCWHFTDSITYGSRTFKFVRPLTIRLQPSENRFWEATVEKLGIFAQGSSPQLALDDLQHEFAVIWDALAFESDDELTEDAQQLKAALRKLVK